MPRKEFKTPQEALAHYGKKGMHWGVRNEDESSGGDSSGAKDVSPDADPVLEEYKAIARAQPKLSGREATKNLQNNQQKSINKLEDGGPELGGSPKDLKREAKAEKLDAKAKAFDDRVKELTAQRESTPDGFRNALTRRSLDVEISKNTRFRDEVANDASRVREGKLTVGQRKAAIAIGVGAVVAGGIAYGSYKNSQQVKNWESEAAAGNVESKLKLYNHQLRTAQAKTWMFGGYIQEESWAREEFELPAGHTFHRLSTKNESEHGYRPGTYSTPDEGDFNRYVAGFRREKGSSELYHVTFKSKTPTRVPDLKTTIETLRETMEREGYGINKVTRADALARYQTLSGGDWDNPTSAKFFSNLKAKGYGAIVDEMDAGVIGDRPLVFFNPENAERKSSRPLDSGEILNREKSIELMTKPPRKG